jgi:hypothetical protein
VVDEVRVHEEIDFLLCKILSDAEEAPVQRSRARAVDGGEEVRPIVRSEGADFNPPPMAQRFDGRI